MTGSWMDDPADFLEGKLIVGGEDNNVHYAMEGYEEYFK